MGEDGTDKTPLSAEEEELWRAFAWVLNVLPRTMDLRLQERANITGPEYVALANLGDVHPDGLRISELAGRVGLSPSRVSRLAESLVRRGEAERTRGGEDGRSSSLTITDAGLARVEAAWPHQVASVREHVLRHLDPADHAALTRSLRAIADAL
ncbi:Transcriptional regulator [Amycolatopsis camponoti]|uniref:Transcriptional regulator n=1 Tax=Amycolatopsis camponoti TaxID=2606593 RepID=A0A6I8LR64_9PSEU|nr:MarR family winged helix-turn-helix transcriptional regulator [Amycolatopsis camponoti]VVJ18407.1 Transcriptional regulator [Amycolatopsis camponoti]